MLTATQNDDCEPSGRVGSYINKYEQELVILTRVFISDKLLIIIVYIRRLVQCLQKL